MKMKSMFAQLCIDVSIWIMVAILGLERIQVKEDIVRIVIEIRREGRRNFRDQRTDEHEEMHTV